MSEEKRLAVLIDSDNVSAKYAQFVMNEVQKYGVPTYKRVYGDWEKGGNGLHAPAVNYSIMPVQQTSYVAGKNATDFSMIIDAMDILYSGNVDGFVLVTSDSDFTRLAIRLREAGKLVVGIGELKTPRPFTVSCHHFCYLNQIGEMEQEYDEAAIRKAVMTFVTDNRDERLDLAKISAVLTSKFGNINFDELGYKRFSSFIDSFPELRRNNTFVSLRKKKSEQPQPRKLEEATAESVAAAMSEYLSEHEPEQDNMLKMESWLNNRFGKIDFAKFGSSRFAKFIDRLPQFTRTGTLVKPADSAPEISLDADSYRREVTAYAGDNMPDGGNIGQLNNELMGAYGRDYIDTMGFGDFRALLSSVPDIKISRNRAYSTVPVQIPAEPAGNPGQAAQPDEAAEAPDDEVRVRRHDSRRRKEAAREVAEVIAEVNGEVPAEPAQEESAQPEESAPVEEVQSGEQENQPAEKEYEKPELNTVKREILQFVASSENGGSLSRLGGILGAKYGHDFLKQLGFSSMRKLAAEKACGGDHRHCRKEQQAVYQRRVCEADRGDRAVCQRIRARRWKPQRPCAWNKAQGAFRGIRLPQLRLCEVHGFHKRHRRSESRQIPRQPGGITRSQHEKGHHLQPVVTIQR